MPYKVLKRDGTLAKWDEAKIRVAVSKALDSDGITEVDEATGQVTQRVMSNFNGHKIIAQEKIQDLIEDSLMQLNFGGAAKNFILYREKRRQAREAQNVYLNVAETIDSYLKTKDWRVNENANMDFSFQGLVLHLSGSMQARYVLDQYPEEIRNSHIQGYLHIHDLSMGLAAYCCGWSLRDLLSEGFNLKGFCSSKPAKHLDSAMSQMVNFIGTLQNEFAGAQAFNNVDTYLAPFIRYDNLPYEKVEQYVQRFIFNLNTTSRWGGQTPFSNITLDLTCPKHLASQPVIRGGVLQKEKYGDFQVEMDMFNKAFLTVMGRGDGDGRIFSFPIPTYNVTKEFPWESEVGRLVLEVTSKYGLPYFQNFVNSDLKPEDVQSMCCRLRIDKKAVHMKTGGLFGAGDLTGSIGVVTLNLPRLAFMAKDENEFLDLVHHYMNIAKKSLELKRKLINNNFKKGMYPWAKRYLKRGFAGHFSTIGLVGGHEACINLLGKGIDTPEGMDLMEKALKSMRDMTIEFQKETGNLYNLEATPAEGCAYRLAKTDKKFCPDIKQSGNGEPYYTNSTQFHPCSDIGPIATVQKQERLQVLYTGGTVQHIYLGEAQPNPEAVKNFILKTFTETKLPYVSITPTFSICENHGYLPGEYKKCPSCDSEPEVYTRVTGYYRPVKRFNKGKAAEWKDRFKNTLPSA